jgi:hydrogenase expression/formation protein HypC
MCLAIPAKVLSIDAAAMAIVEIGGIRKEASVELLDDVNVGDYVIVHVGYALSRIDEEEARRTLALFEEMAQTAEQAP